METTINSSISYDYSSYYDENYLNFSPCETTELRQFGSLFLPTLYSLVFILGFTGNGLVVYVLVKHRNQTNLTDICILNLAIADLVFVFTLPFYAYYSIVGQWTLGDLMCRLMAASHCIGFYSSILFMIAVTLDRYFLIVHTCKVGRFRTLNAAICLSVFVWLLSLSFSIPTFVFTKVRNESGEREETRETCSSSPENKSWNLYNIFATNILGLIIPMLVMVVCYSRIIPRLLTIRSKKKHQVIKLIIIVVVTFFLFWAPYNISIFVKVLQSLGKLQSDCTFDQNLRLSVVVTETIAYVHCCLNPIIYAFVGQKFMKRAMQLLNKCVPWFHVHSFREQTDSSFRRSSASDVRATIIM